MEKSIKKHRLGKTDLFITELGFGSASIGNLYNACTDEQSKKLIQKSWELGIRYFDTAPEYGRGLSERRLGDGLRQYSREQYVVSNKIGDFLYPIHNQIPPESKFINPLPFHLRFDYSYDGIMRSFEDGLQRLGLNHVDILLVHDLDPIIHSQKVFEAHLKIYLDSGYKALEKLRCEGMIKAVGLGVKKWEVCETALQYGDYECFMLQGNYTLLEQNALNHFFPTCLEKKIAIFIAGPFASGILATGSVHGARFNHQAAPSNILKKVKQIEAICGRHNTPLPAAALQFPLFHPAVISIVLGCDSAAQIERDMDYFYFDIPTLLWEELKEAGWLSKEAPTPL